jgi:branched-chain amino acid transport system ATP-binding protein
VSAVLLAEAVALRFGGLHVLRDLSFAVAEGSITSLIGPNGAGKTSVFNCLTGFYRPSGGRVTFLGRPTRGLRPHRITQMGLARTFQNLRLFREMTALENVMSGQHCRTRAGLIGAMLALPSQRRVEWARALATQPRLLLLDEPAAGLNHDEKEDLLALIRRVREALGVTVLLIEHDMGLVMRVSESIIVLDHGQKIAEGDAASVQANPLVVEAYLGRDEDE